MIFGIRRIKHLVCAVRVVTVNLHEHIIDYCLPFPSIYSLISHYELLIIYLFMSHFELLFKPNHLSTLPKYYLQIVLPSDFAGDIIHTIAD